MLSRRNLFRAAGAAAAGTAAYTRGEIPAAFAQTSPAKTLLPVNIVNASGNPGLCLEELIKRRGYLEEFGVSATFTNAADSSKIIASLIGGDMDICMVSGLGQVFPVIAKGGNLKIVAGANSLAPISLFSKNPEIKTLQDFAGKTIGTGAIGSALQQVCVALFKKKGLDINKVTFVNVGSTSDILKAVASGGVDAGVVNVDAYGVKDKYGIHPVADFFVDLAEYPYQGSFASGQAIAKKRETLVRTLAAHAKLYQFIQSPGSGDEYVAAYLAATGGTKMAAMALWQFMQKYKPYDTGLVLPESSISYLQQVNVETGVQKTIMPFNKVADMSLARDAVTLKG